MPRTPRAGHADPASPRPRKPRSLSAPEIAAAGLRIAREGDLERLTMKRLGQALGVSPMAIYRHYRDKAELVDAILEAFVAESAPTAHGVDPARWQDWLRESFGRMHRALLSTPGVMGYLGHGWRFGDAGLAVLDESLAVLRGAGLSRREAVEAFGALLGFTIGCAAMDAALGAAEGDEEAAAAPEDRAERRRRMRARLAAASRTEHPEIVDCAGELASLVARRRGFDAGLEQVIAGIAARADADS